MTTLGARGRITAPALDPDLETAFLPVIASGFDFEDTRLKHGRKGDNRLYPDWPLYCEGLEKPLCRGMLHLLTTVLLPFGLLHLLREANHKPLGMAAATLYALSNIFCYGVSSLYHVGRWSPRVEILLQKLDHCGIAILSVGTFVPVTFLLFPTAASALLLFVLLSACTWTCWNIIARSSASVTRQVLVPASSLLFIPVFFSTLNRLEFILYWIIVAFQLLGVVVFVRKRPSVWPRVCGYHELFHVFVVAAGISVYLINWSIIRRTCKPYEHEDNVLRLILNALTEAFETASSASAPSVSA